MMRHTHRALAALRLLILTGTAGIAAPSLYSVRDFGAAGDGTTKDTTAIQKAVDAASAAGGGTVVLPPGTYLSGTIVLKSGAALHIARGAALLGSTDPRDYPRTSPRIHSYTDNYVNMSLIYAEKVHDIGISGAGVIDGQGAAYRGNPYLERPYLIRIVSSRNVQVTGITLKNSAMWVQHYLACDFVTIRGISVHSHVNHNNDMLDIDSCRNVRISDCFGDTGDDAITLKSTTARPCENVVVTNCVLFSNCNAIKCGTESNGGFKNVSISNCTIGPMRDTGGIAGKRMLAGIALEIVDGGAMERVAISNLTMKGVRVPIFIRLGNRARPYKKAMARPGMGALRDVTISNVVAEATERYGCSITGLPGFPARNISLSDIQLRFPGGGTAEEAARAIPEKPAAYPECSMFGILPAYAFYCRHVEGLTFRNVNVGSTTKDRRPALVCEDVKDLNAEGFKALTGKRYSERP